MSQAVLPFQWPAAERETDFIVTEANEAAVRHLSHLSVWPVMATILTGPRKSGKSFIGRIFAARTGGTLIDGGEAADEEQLFHAWNRAQSDRKPLLIIADAPPPIWEVALPDLQSRLAATPHVALQDPDDRLITALIERFAASRGIIMTPDLPAWIAKRIERSYIAVHRSVDALDRIAWGRRARIGPSAARDALIAAGVMVAQ